MDLSKATWHKSSHSSDQGDNCIEVVSAPGTVAIRDSKDPDGPRILLNRHGLRRLASAIKSD